MANAMSIKNGWLVRGNAIDYWSSDKMCHGGAAAQDLMH